ncbi:DEAD/DEAH box helicase family protein [Bradyrhizobium sp. NBAIM01]|uniref:EcoAI/FtnUII family type I restriction enzme subunit R n=1 Tax=Bradyrhizobium sp. NBAIM01 TaxID=2793818 RepID=UPI001CD69047|nr:DEAD/DEAH box helicase family protein [Bradyrhizobium sp. NBAIM01]MCA1513649.1 DEAD/DEAH box helicase family protein [Bradyrhizobium sp. NBAIM01]
MSEADTCRKFVVPALQRAGWDDAPHSIAEQRTITDGRIVPVGSSFVRKAPKRVDYLLRYTRDFPLAVVEAKASYKSASDGVQQAKTYAAILGLQFAYATNGHEIIEIDFTTGGEHAVEAFPTPKELWLRYCTRLAPSGSTELDRLLTPSNYAVKQGERYYQQIAINRAVERILLGTRRTLITMATGTGKTAVAFQICWKLWTARWNRSAEYRRPRILYLADRNILIDQPKDGIFSAFGDARHKIDASDLVLSRELYFGTYQILAEDERRPGLFRSYPRDFFDLIIIDECHRGSARDDSNWRAILEYFEPAYHLGMTATPLREETRDTYRYFGDPIFEYSLRQGIEDGFLAPYRVHRVVTEWDAVGWRPTKGDIDRYGRPIPDDEYGTRDFEKVVALRARTEAIASHLTNFLKSSDRLAKTIIFCVDQEHASEMRRALSNKNVDLFAQYPDYVCRVTADEGDIGRGHLSRFQDVDSAIPAILTTSQLLTTGVDAPTCKNVVIARVVGTMSEFKQIIGRGTRVRDDYGKLWFNIIDYTGSATQLFADPAFDGEPAELTQEEILPSGDVAVFKTSPALEEELSPTISEPPSDERKKYYFDGGRIEIAAHVVYELDQDGKQLRVIQYTKYAAEAIKTICPTLLDLRHQWTDSMRQSEILKTLAERGISFAELAAATQQPDADPFDLLCHLAFNAPLKTRRERAQRLRTDNPSFFERYSPAAREILELLLEKYAEHGDTQFILPDALHVPPISSFGQVNEITKLFGGPAQLRAAVQDLQKELYAA